MADVQSVFIRKSEELSKNNKRFTEFFDISSAQFRVPLEAILKTFPGTKFSIFKIGVSPLMRRLKNAKRLFARSNFRLDISIRPAQSYKKRGLLSFRFYSCSDRCVLFWSSRGRLLSIAHKTDRIPNMGSRKLTAVSRETK